MKKFSKFITTITLACMPVLGLFSQGNYATPYTFFGLAGAVPQVADGVDGVGVNSRFNTPTGIAIDGGGNLYVADTINHTIRKITSAGVVSTFAGAAGLCGSTNGTGSAARFNNPRGVAVDGNGNVYVGDTGNHTIRKITSAGVVTTLAGVAGEHGSSNGPAVYAHFASPYGVAVDGRGNVYVADSTNHMIRVITSDGVVTTLAGSAGVSGSADGTGSDARFYSPYGLAVDGTGNVYVADRGNTMIRKITSEGVVTTLAGAAGMIGAADGVSGDARFFRPEGLTVDGNGNVFVADTFNNTIRKITPEGVVTTVAGSPAFFGTQDGMGSAARFQSPLAVTVDINGNVYVADGYFGLIRKIASDSGVTTLAGAPTIIPSGSMNGTGGNARFGNSYGLAVQSNGTIYVADTSNQLIRKITTGGVVTTLAGSALATGSPDGAGASARFNNPYGVAVDAAGTVYVADTANYTVRKITAGGVVTTLAGTAMSTGSVDGAGADARFVHPYGIAVDGNGTVYVADEQTVRKITPEGVVTTLAGQAGSSGSTDGTGSEARFGFVAGIAVDGRGTVYVADNQYSKIRKITPEGVVTTLTGAASSGYADGTGTAAKFSSPWAVAVDGSGDLYVADRGNSVVRKVTSAGVVTTLAGAAGGVGSNEGTGITARFYSPWGVAVTAAGQVVVADAGNHRILAAAPYLTHAGEAAGTAGQAFVFTITANVPAIAYGATGMPTGLSVNAMTGEVSGTPMVAGTFAVTLSATNVYGKIGTGVLSLTVAKGNQSITFPTPASKILGDAAFILDATASSELALSYTVVSGPATINGSTVTLTGVGTVVVRASQPGNDNFYAAESVERSFSVVAPGITLSSLSATYDGTPKAATATTVPAGLNVDFTYDGSTAPPKNAGSYKVVGTIHVGDYSGSAVGTLVISKATLLATVDTVVFVGKSALPIPVTYGGFASGDDVSVLNRPPTIKTSVSIQSTPGVYPVTVTSGSDDNYTIIPIAGEVRLVSYEGVYEVMLKVDDEGPWTGKIELTLGAGASYTGKLWLSDEGAPLTLRGTLGFSGSSTTATGRVQVAGRAVSSITAPVYSVDLALPENGVLEATVEKGADLVAVSAQGVKCWAPINREKVTWSGAYTWLLREPAPLDAEDALLYPAGSGYASAKISAAGVMKVTGALADGTKFTATLNPDDGATPGYRLYVQPYSQRAGSYLSSVFRLSAHPSREGMVYLPEATGQDVYWTKSAAATDANYRAGFGPLGLTVTMDPWLGPGKTVTLANTLSLGEGNVLSVAYRGVARVANEPALPASVSLINGTTPTVSGPNPLAWTIKIDNSTGIYTGSFVLNDRIEVGGLSAIVKRTVPFAGALRQTGEDVIGAGMFLLPAFPTDPTNETVSGEILFARP